MMSELHIAVVIALVWVEVTCKLTGSLVLLLLLAWFNRMILVFRSVFESTVYITEEGRT